MADAWVSAHLFHRGNLDDLITGAVAPLIAGLTRSGALAEYFFLRYWEGGPHLRLRLLPTCPGHTDQVRDALIQRCTRYLTDHPSPPPPPTHTSEAYRVMARQQALAERRSDHDPRLHPDDTVEFITYHPEYPAYGQRPALTAVEAHFTDSSTIALGLLTAGTPPAQRHAAALAMLMLTLAVCEPDLARLASRLHRVAPRAPEGYQHTRHALDAQARDLWSRADRTCRTSLGGPLATWLHSIRTLHARLTTAQAQGRFAPQDSLSPLACLAQVACPHSPVVAQVLLRCTHLLCNRLGIQTTAERHIASLVAHTLTGLDQGGEDP